MRLTTPAAAAALLLSLGSAHAALQTDAYDGVESEVAARSAALTGATGAERKLARAYGKVAKLLAKESASRKSDAKAVRKINKLLGRAWKDDADALDLLTKAFDAFVADLSGGLVQCDRGNDLLGTTNRHRKKALKGYDGAVGLFARAGADDDTLASRTRWMLRAERAGRRAHAATLAGLADEPQLTPHQKAFLLDRPDGYSGPQDCATCHSDEIADVRASFHFQWEYTTDKVVDHEGHTHGKSDILNNFCIAIPSNEPRCTQCHAGYGWSDAGYDRSTAAVDCLVCHDTTGTYKKAKKTAGSPEPGIDLTNVVLNVGDPSRANCGACHYYAGGGDNVKHGDLASSLTSTTRENDVHMGTDGGDMTCQACHRNPGDYDHTTPGHGLTSGEGELSCADCHTDAPHGGLLDVHAQRVACQTCHIPAFSRVLPTKVLWEWETAGRKLPVETDEFGKPLYDNLKGTFRWDKSVRPTVAWFNGTWERVFIGDADTYEQTPVRLAAPVGSRKDESAKLYPFKVMRGNQIADTGNRRIVTPHLFGTATGYYPFWGTWSWALSIAEGAMATGTTYSGEFGFVDTEMYMSLNHEVAPAEDALACASCHGKNGLDWEGLGYAANPHPVED